MSSQSKTAQQPVSGKNADKVFKGVAYACGILILVVLAAVVELSATKCLNKTLSSSAYRHISIPCFAYPAFSCLPTVLTSSANASFMRRRGPAGLSGCGWRLLAGDSAHGGV